MLEAQVLILKIYIPVSNRPTVGLWPPVYVVSRG